MLTTKHAPRKAGSKLLEKKWQDHDYMLHKYRLLAMYGDPGPKPLYNNLQQQQQQQQQPSPPQKRKTKSARGRVQKPIVEMPSADVTPRRPYTSKPAGLKTRPATTRSKGLDSNSSNPINNRNSRPATSVNTAARGSARLPPSGRNGNKNQLSARQQGKTPLSARSDQDSGRKEKLPPKRPLMQQWMRPKPHGYRPLPKRYRSEYSRDRMDQHYKKHQFIKHNILQKTGLRPLPRRKTDGDDSSSEESNYSNDFESDSTDIPSADNTGADDDDGEDGSGKEERGYVPSPTPTPEPIKEVEKLDMDDDEHPEIPDTPVNKPIVEYPKVEINFTPPSHVLKIVKDAKDEEGSDWSEDDPVYVLKDGKKGTYIMKDHKYYLAEMVKDNRKKRLKKKLTEKRKKTEQADFKEVHYINYEAEDENEEDEDEEGNGGFDGLGEESNENKEIGVFRQKESRNSRISKKEGYGKNDDGTSGDEDDEGSSFTDDDDDGDENNDDFKDGDGSDVELKLLADPEESEYDENGEKIVKNKEIVDAVREESDYDTDGNKIIKVKKNISDDENKPNKMRRKRRKRKKRSERARKASPFFIDYKNSDEEREEERKQKYEAEEKKRIEQEKKIKSDGDEEMDFKVLSNSETDEEDRKKLQVEPMDEEDDEDDDGEKFASLRPETVEEKFFDAKRDEDGDSDLDEFGRLKDRQRPSSTLFDFLPPLKPDPRLDGGDITNCKNRLSRHVVIIREALARNGPGDLEIAVDVIISNNCDNRRWLRKIYRDSYLTSLLLDLRKTLPSDVASVMSYMMISVCEFDANCLWDALKGLQKEAEVLCEILCTRTNKELEEIRDAYSLRYGEELIDHIEDETISAFQRMLMRLASGQREEEASWTREDAKREAKAIHVLLKMKGQHCTKKLIDVFCQHPIEMLRCIINEYRKLTEKELDVELITILKGNFQRCIITIIHYIQNPPNYFVEKLHATHFKGVDDDKALCRLLISRSEPEKLEMIKQLFVLRYHMQLYNYVDRVCNGPLKGLVLRIVAGQLVEEERDKYNFPQLWPGRDEAFAAKRLTLPKAVLTILRRAKVTTKLAKILWTQREKQREEDESGSEFDDPDEIEEGGEEAEESKEPMNSEEEEEEEEKAAARELKNGLKNISFAPEVEVTEIDGYESVFKDISFANASRGILKNVNSGIIDDENAEGGVDADGNPITVDDQEESGNHKLTQLNGPVIDPTFSGRGNQPSGRVPFTKGKKKPMQRVTVHGVSMENFNALKDAQAIGKALLQKKRNIEGILQFLATRNNAQRQLIIREFFRRYRRDLVDDLRMLGPYFEDVTLSMLLANEIYDAISLYAGINDPDPVKGVDIIIAVLCARQNDEIAIIRRAFQGIFGMNMIEEIEKITIGHCQNLLCLILECQRDESQNIDERKVKRDAQALYEAVIRRPPENGTIVELLATRSFQHIALVCDEFSRINKADILEAAETLLQGTFREAVIALVCNTRDAPMYFCERIYKCLAYYPPDYSQLIREVVSRSEVDLAIVKVLFRRTYGRTIYNMIDKDSDFISKKILLDVVKK